MGTAVVHSGGLSEAERRYWEDRLKKVGFTKEQAYVLAGRPGLDLHAVEATVVDRGCDPTTCFDIYS